VIFESYDVKDYSGDIGVIAMGAYAEQCRTAEGAPGYEYFRRGRRL